MTWVGLVAGLFLLVFAALVGWCVGYIQGAHQREPGRRWRRRRVPRETANRPGA